MKMLRIITALLFVTTLVLLINYSDFMIAGNGKVIEASAGRDRFTKVQISKQSGNKLPSRCLIDYDADDVSSAICANCHSTINRRLSH